MVRPVEMASSEATTKGNCMNAPAEGQSSQSPSTARGR